MQQPGRLAVVDCPTGLAGNMLLAALLDLGLPEAVVHEPLAALGLAEAYRLELRRPAAGVCAGFSCRWPSPSPLRPIAIGVRCAPS
jgi:hypothetical protein